MAHHVTITPGGWKSIPGPKVSFRCPFCGSLGTFDPIGDDLFTKSSAPTFLGHRRCPNEECNKHVFVVIYEHFVGYDVITYPPQRMPFDKSNVPDEVASTLEEAITCYSHGCYVAAAIMVRRTLEAICDEKGCKSGHLHNRLQELTSQIVIPKDLVDAMFELKLLGNDAAHIDSKAYKHIGKEEVESAIELAKEIIKALYQYNWLVSKLVNLRHKQQQQEEHNI